MQRCFPSKWRHTSLKSYWSTHQWKIVIEAKLALQQVDVIPPNPPGVHEFTDTAPLGVARGFDDGVDVAASAAKFIDRPSTYRGDSFEPRHCELLCPWHSAEWVLRMILQGPSSRLVKAALLGLSFTQAR